MPGYFHEKASIVKKTNQMDIVKVLKTNYSKFYNLLAKHKLVKMISSADNLTIFALSNETLGSIMLSKEKILDHILQYSRSPPPNYKKMKTFKTLSDIRVSATKYKKYIKKSREIITNQGNVYKTDEIL